MARSLAVRHSDKKHPDSRRKISQMASEQDVLDALTKVKEPDLDEDIVSLNLVKDLQVNENRVAFTLSRLAPAVPGESALEAICRDAISGISGVSEVEVKTELNVSAAARTDNQEMLPGVKNSIAIASGKGGVGKSTVAINMAVTLSRMGAKVGLLDADIYGPSIPMMAGIEGTVEFENVDGKFLPVEAHGLKIMSIGFLLKEDQPVIWRGPMAHQALRQFIGDWDWGELDYLILDLPPGTGDIQLTLVQSIPLSGSVIVCTPQDLALLDAKKGLRMFQQVHTPILGIVENMSWYVCPHCGERTEIFSHGGAKTAAEALQVSFLGEIPMELEVRVGGDEGRPYMTGENDETAVGQSYFELSNNLVTEIKKNNHQTSGRGPTISIKR